VVRLFVTGGTGFVGSNVVKVARERHAMSVTTTVHSWRPKGDEDFEWVGVDMLEPEALRAAVLDARPDAIVHAAILTDFVRMDRDRRLAWDAYVGATRTLVDAANATGAKVVLVSTDWVFDGSQGPADETTPPNPINLYGVLKVICETVVLERARNGAVARLAGVNGVHWARDDYVPRQDPGFGHLAGAICSALRNGERFALWVDESINMVATPSLASESAEMILRIIETDQTGVFHCVGGEATTRVDLAGVVVDVFDLNGELLDQVPPDVGGLEGWRFPYDTSLSAERTADRLDYELPALRRLLEAFRTQMETGQL
jgi:dTDP-4-dehydrorhamnose reductase